LCLGLALLRTPPSACVSPRWAAAAARSTALPFPPSPSPPRPHRADRCSGVTPLLAFTFAPSGTSTGVRSAECVERERERERERKREGLVDAHGRWVGGWTHLTARIHLLLEVCHLLGVVLVRAHAPVTRRTAPLDRISAYQVGQSWPQRGRGGSSYCCSHQPWRGGE
jgi:hypothetical protein